MEIHANIHDITGEVITEIISANNKWGVEFDKKNTLNDWVTYINMYASQAARMDTPLEQVRPLLIKAAGLVISAIGTLDANGSFAPRHYAEDTKAKF